MNRRPLNPSAFRAECRRRTEAKIRHDIKSRHWWDLPRMSEAALSRGDYSAVRAIDAEVAYRRVFVRYTVEGRLP